MINTILLGYPGSGKTTLARKMMSEYDFVHIETGSIFRDMIKKQSAEGEKIKKYLSKGKLVPDDIVEKVIHTKIKENLSSNGLLFDGFPRNLEQAGFLDNMLQENDTQIHIVLLLKIDKETAKKRILEQRHKETDREDDKNEEMVKKRIERDSKVQSTITNHYKKQDILIEIDASLPIKKIESKIQGIIENR